MTLTINGHTYGEGAYVSNGRYVYFNTCSCGWRGTATRMPDSSQWNAHIEDQENVA